MSQSPSEAASSKVQVQLQPFRKQFPFGIRKRIKLRYNKVPIRRLPNWLPICLRGEWKVPQKFHGLGLIEQKRKAEVFSLRLSGRVKLCSHKPWCVRREAFCPHRRGAYLKYLFSSPSRALPCLASSRAISCTVSWMASRPFFFAQAARSNLP